MFVHAYAETVLFLYYSLVSYLGPTHIRVRSFSVLIITQDYRRFFFYVTYLVIEVVCLAAWHLCLSFNTCSIRYKIKDAVIKCIYICTIRAIKNIYFFIQVASHISFVDILCPFGSGIITLFYGGKLPRTLWFPFMSLQYDNQRSGPLNLL